MAVHIEGVRKPTGSRRHPSPVAAVLTCSRPAAVLTVAGRQAEAVREQDALLAKDRDEHEKAVDALKFDSEEIIM